MRKGIAIGAVITVAVALTAACGSASGSSNKSSAGLTTVNIGYVPFDDDAVLFLAVEKGFFAKHGLKVNLHEAASPSPIVASMASGQYQFGFVTTPVLINANLAGQKVQCVSVMDGQVDPTSDSAGFVASSPPLWPGLLRSRPRPVQALRYPPLGLAGRAPAGPGDRMDR